MDQKYFGLLLMKALAEKYRTDAKYGDKETGKDNKARLIACITENLGTFLSEQREGNMGEQYYINTLAHLISLSTHIKTAQKGAQYKD